MCAALKAQTDVLSTGTSCTVLGVHEVTVKGKKAKLIKLRNVFKTTDWKGDWSNGSSLWTKDVLS